MTTVEIIAVICVFQCLMYIYTGIEVTICSVSTYHKESTAICLFGRIWSQHLQQVQVNIVMVCTITGTLIKLLHLGNDT